MQRRSFLLGLMAAPLTAPVALAAVPAVDAKGLHIEDWLGPPTGDLRRDLEHARAANKVLAVFWEATPCVYCDELHVKALRDPTMREYVAQRFHSVRYDRLGKGPLIDFNGAERSERDTALAHRVLGTPTIEFRVADAREVMRVPGYLGFNLLRSSFEYVDEGGYRQAGFAKWLQQRPR